MEYAMKSDKYIPILLLVLSFVCTLFPQTAVCNDKQDTAAKEEMAVAPDAAALLKDIEKKLSDFKNLKTDFIEEKYLAIFKKKIVLQGRIYLQKPDKIAWHVDKPVRYSVLITDKSIRQWDEDTGKVQEIALSGNPVFKMVLGQMTAWFSGSYGTLEGDYNIKIKRRNPAVIEFTPKENNFAKKVISSVTVRFREDERYLRQIAIKEISGDSTIITFEKTVIDTPIDDRFFTITSHG